MTMLLPVRRGSLWERLRTTESFDPVLAAARASPWLAHLSVDTTSACDLACEGCYYHPDIDTARPMATAEAVLNALGCAYERLGTRLLVVAGKEPFLNLSKLWGILEGAREGRPDLDVGLITNGRHLHRHWLKLEALSDREDLQFIDVSFDSGYAEEHDAVRRRQGTFQLSFDALCEAVERLPKLRVGTSCVLRQGNSEGLLELIRRTAKLSVAHWVTPLLPPPFTTEPPLPVGTVALFIRRLEQLLRGELSDNAIDVTVSLPSVYLYDLVDSDMIGDGELCETVEGLPYIDRQVGNSRLRCALGVVAEAAWRHGRILADGSYLPHVYFLQTAEPHHYAVGQIQDTSMVDLYERSIAPGSLFEQVIASRANHACRNRPCWGMCFGGWSLAENTLLNHQALTEKPRACPRPDQDHQ